MGYRGYSIFMEKIPPVASAEIEKELKYQIRVDITIGMTQLVLGKLPTGDSIPHQIKIKPNYWPPGQHSLGQLPSQDSNHSSG